MYPENYGPILLLAVTSVVERLLHAQIVSLLEGYIRSEQFGFCKEHT